MLHRFRNTVLLTGGATLATLVLTAHQAYAGGFARR